MNDKGSAGILKYLGEDLKRHPENRLSSTEQCIEKVLQGSCVYIYVKEIFKIRIKNHWFMLNQ